MHGAFIAQQVTWCM